MTDGARQSNGRAGLMTILQMSSSSFPTGAFSHSYGFETWLSARVIASPAEAERRARHWLRFGVATGDAVAVAGAFRRALHGREEDLVGLNRAVGALKISRESREASLKTGAAWIAACREVFALSEITALEALQRRHKIRIHHSVAFGVTTAALGFTEDEAVETYLFTTFSNLVSVLGRLLPIGQVQVQRILSAAQPLIAECADIARTRSEDRMSSQYASLDIASMQHERMPSRLCIS